MADPFVGEIRMFAGNFAPTGWALCNGQLLSIAQNPALFSLLGPYYGGDGKTTFGLPNLQGAAPLMAGQGPGLTSRDLGEIGGETAVTLTTAQMPLHPHSALATASPGSGPDPGSAVWAMAAVARGTVMYTASPGTSPQMSPQALSAAGGSQPHNNMPPYLGVNFIIALQGEFPPRA